MRRNLAIVAGLLFWFGPALAQSQAPVSSSQQQKLGGARPSPEPSSELKEARRAVRQACLEDIRSLCAASEPGGGKVMMCIRSHGDQVSKDCQAALVHLRAVRRGA